MAMTQIVEANLWQLLKAGDETSKLVGEATRLQRLVVGSRTNQRFADLRTLIAPPCPHWCAGVTRNEPPVGKYVL